MQSFAGAETTRRFSSTLNSTWPMTRRQPKYAARKAHRVHDELGLDQILLSTSSGRPPIADVVQGVTKISR
jgi:hypothetical protein